MKRKVTAILSGLTIVLAAGCGQGNSNSGDGEPLQIMTTTAQIGDIAENVAGDQAEIETLMGPGVDPHLYQASQNDIQKLADADIIFYNGLHLEGNLVKVFEEIKNDVPTIAVGENVPEEELITEEGGNSSDPHVWFDPNRWTYAVDEVAAGLAELNEDEAGTYQENADEYISMLEELDQYADEKLQSIPEESRILVTAHDAFGYFGDAYGFEVNGLQGLSTDSEYSVRDVNNLVSLLVENDIKAVFVESSVSERAINAVIKGAADQGHEVSIGGELYSDAMGEAGTEEGTYEGMFRHNIDTITSSLK
ncbi:metal ABC transporter solute-binding protein, Zn/Mn family [Alteribacillus sp. HJP-4]|uniref:metal ABC transporter solute-binding protein, Zn/Mn family n=1 Tax=Alteribacillus sp. HJP-4 TaxID=2775394 RepID=UPI0035CCD715